MMLPLRKKIAKGKLHLASVRCEVAGARGAMRRRQAAALALLALSWVGATYFLFAHRPGSSSASSADGDGEDELLGAHLDALEERMRRQFADNDRLLQSLKRVVDAGQRKQQQQQQQLADGGLGGGGGGEFAGGNEVELPEPQQQPQRQQQEEEEGQEGQDGMGQQLEEDGHMAHERNEGMFEGGDESDLPIDQEGHRPPAGPPPHAIFDKEQRIQRQRQQQMQQAPPPPPPPPEKTPQELQTEHLRSLAAAGATAVLVMACNRVTVRQCLDQLLQHRPSSDNFPIIASLDCAHQATSDALRPYSDKLYIMHQPDQSEIDVPPKEKKFRGYFNIARHYRWALNQVFFHFNFKTAIVVEDDLDIAPDFFEYFASTLPLLRKDPTLWCVSAWNDNGKGELVDDNAPQLLHRTDFFPGLGWMLTSDTWAELAPKWPPSYWDDWVRQPEQRQGRACIRPELSRTRTFGKVGVSNGHFFDKHLKFIKLNDKFVPFTQLDLSYLLKDNYDVDFVRKVYDSPVVTYQELRSGAIVTPGPVRIPYHTKDAYKRTAKLLGLMDDFRSGVPRTGYRGVVSFMHKGRRVYLAPNANWKAYDPSWS